MKQFTKTEKEKIITTAMTNARGRGPLADVSIKRLNAYFEYTARAAELAKVSAKTTKSGKEFEHVAQAVEGASIRYPSYRLTPTKTEPSIAICFESKKIYPHMSDDDITISSHYVSYDFPIYDSANRKDSAKTYARAAEGVYGTMYIYTAAEINKEIARQIAIANDNANKAIAELDALPRALERVKKAAAGLRDILEQYRADGLTSLYYSMAEIAGNYVSRGYLN